MEWISVKKQLPKKDGRYLIRKILNIGKDTVRYDVISFAKDGRKVDKYDFQRDWKNVWYEYNSEWGYITLDSVTHWMPLPDEPKEDSEGMDTSKKESTEG